MIKNCILAVLSATTLVAASLAGAVLLEEPEAPAFDPGAYAMQYACTTLGVDCSELPAPEIKFLQSRALGLGMLGYYWPTDEKTANIVWLDLGYEDTIKAADFASNPHAWEVLVHEVSHYVDYHLAVSSYRETRNACASETLGWHVGNSWLVEHGYANLAVWDWWERYANCDGPVSYL